jgi:hypothetical protein
MERFWVAWLDSIGCIDPRGGRNKNALSKIRKEVRNIIPQALVSGIPRIAAIFTAGPRVPIKKKIQRRPV